MTNKLKTAFDSIHAEETLKADTLSFLQDRIRQNRQENHILPVKRFAALCACLFAVILAGVFSHGIYFTEAMFVNVDINPSVELTVNRFDRVIGVYAYNADGERLLSRLDLMHKPYDIAVNTLTDTAIQDGFLPDGGLVSVTLQTGDTDRESMLLQTLQSNVTSAVQGHHASAQIDVFAVGGETRAHSHDLNLSPAKYLAILELQEVDPTATVEGCRGHSIGEIRSLAEHHGGGHHAGNSGSANSSASAEEKERDRNITVPDRNAGHHGNGHHGNRRR